MGLAGFNRRRRELKELADKKAKLEEKKVNKVETKQDKKKATTSKKGE